MGLMLTRIAVTVLALVSYTGAAPAASKAVVYKDPYCGCCEGYIAHLRAHGFDAVARNTDRVEVVKKMRGVPEDLWSCHTMTIGRYAVEGHVPLAAVERLLSEKPNIKGIALAGMPTGSPGMPGPKEEPFIVHAFGKHGISVFMKL